MKIIGLVQRKGGCGKTTIAINLSGALHSRGYSVTLVDADPQRSSFDIAEVGKLPFTTIESTFSNSRQMGRWADDIREINSDFVIIDSPPLLDDVFGGTIAISNLVLVPCTPSGIDLAVTHTTLDVINEMREKDGEPKILLVPSRVDLRTRLGTEVKDALSDLGHETSETIGDRSAYIDSLIEGKWIGDYKPTHIASLENDALALKVLKMLKHKIRK